MKKKQKQQSIGIWGFGTVGKSALRFFKNQNISVEIFDSRHLTKKEIDLINQAKATWANTQKLELFLKKHDTILASPGIDLQQYQNYNHKWITELDLIEKFFQKPVIAITGTAGKTTVTHLLSEFLKKSKIKVWTGGNIGTGMLDLLNEKEKIDCAVLEVSSFQLEQCKKFAPTLAIWTNFSPNHLDRHETEKNYFAAKKKIIDNQHKGQHAIVPLCLKKLFNFCGKITPSLTFFSFNPEWKNEFANCLRVANVVYVKNNSLMRHNYNKEVKELNLSNIFNALPSITFRENLLIISLALDLIGKLLNKPIIFKKNTPIALPPHRLEYVATINKVSFYNDSKSTTSASTIAAVKKCADKPVLLLLGGLSKGADRFELVKKIKPYIKKVYAFGAEEEILKKALIQNNVSYQSFFSLDEAFSSCFADAQADDQILLSPAGSSFDLFKNYEERGNYFKKLVLQLKQ